MIKNITYVILFIIFGIIFFLAKMIEKKESISTIPVQEFESSRPNYNDANIETIFKQELGN